MAEHHHEEEQIEAIKRWWQENRWFVVAGLVIGFTVVGGWRGWQWYRNHQAEAASQLYGQLSDALSAKEADKVAGLAAQLMTDYAMTPYAAQAALIEAKRQVDANDLTKAAVALEWAVAHGKDEELTALARIRLARIKVATGDGAAALTALTGVGGAYAALAADARGDAEAALGHTEEARRAWQQALDTGTDNLADSEMIRLKLAALGPAVVPATSPGTKP